MISLFLVLAKEGDMAGDLCQERNMCRDALETGQPDNAARSLLLLIASRCFITGIK